MRKKKHYSNKIAIVTGGASGIGKAICEYLARHGSKVIIADLNLEGAQETESLITSKGGFGKAIKIDGSNPRDVKSVIEDTVKEHGHIDFLFNNAGIGINGEFQDITLDHWKRIIDVNLWGVVYGCQYVYPFMMEQGFGHIINTASLAGLIPGGLTTSYSASKYAVVGFSLTLRAEAKLYGIKVSALCPGYIRTGIQETTPSVTEYLNSEKNKEMNARMRFPTPEDCIKQIMRGVKRNKAIIISPRLHKAFWLLNRAFPSFNIRMFTMIIKNMKKQT